MQELNFKKIYTKCFDAAILLINFSYQFESYLKIVVAYVRIIITDVVIQILCVSAGWASQHCILIDDDYWLNDDEHPSPVSTLQIS